MLSVETLALLRSLLVAIAEGEMSIEKQRRTLGKLVKFEPYAAFQRIDRKRTGFVDSMDILTFLRENGFSEETEADTYYLMKFFDVDDDQKLNYTEFLTLVLPCDNAKLRNEIILRPNFYVGLLDYLPKSIEYELCKLFVKEIAFHRRTEKIKQELACKPDFDNKAGFKAIDDWNYNYIDFSNLKRFLKSSGHISTNKELSAIIRRLDLNADSRLSLEEFAEGIKPTEPYSRVTVTKAIKTSKQKTSKVSKLSKSSKSASKISQRRPKTAVPSSKGKNKLNSGSKSMVKEKKSTKKRVESPMRQGDSIRRKIEVQQIEEEQVDTEEEKESRPRQATDRDRTRSPIRAYKDRDEEASVSHSRSEYDRGHRDERFEDKKISGSRGYRDDREGRPTSPTRDTHDEHKEYSRYESPNRYSEYRSPTRHSRHGQSPERSPLRSPQRSPHRTSVYHYDNYFPRSPPKGHPVHDHTLRHHEEKEFVAALHDLLNMELDLEQKKIDLSLKPDFNLVDLFRMFDIEHKGYITFSEFKSGLYLFHIYPTTDDAFLLFSRYTSTEEGILKYSDFCDIFCPKTEEYYGALMGRPSYYVHKPYYRISEFFHPDTRRTIEDLLADNLRCESMAETIRQHLALIPTFNAMDAFNTCDMQNEGALTKKQFRHLLESHGIYTKDSDFLVDRFDKDKDGKVTYGEFADEVRPRSPIRRVAY